MAKFVYNNREHSATKFSLFYVNYERHSEGFELISTTNSTYSVEQWVKHIKDVHELAKKSLDKAANAMKKYYDCYSGLSLQYKPGDKVLLDSRSIKAIRLTKKFNHKWLGPFKVDSKVGASTYKLKLPQGQFIHLVFNKILLRPYVPPAFNV